MKYNPDIHRRHSIRLKHYDYTQTGAYFVTICAWGRECLFGDVVDTEMRLNEYGRVVEKEWIRTPLVRPNVELDEFMVMPNHFHAIIIVGATRRVALNERWGILNQQQITQNERSVAVNKQQIVQNQNIVSEDSIRRQGYQRQGDPPGRPYYGPVVRFSRVNCRAI